MMRLFVSRALLLMHYVVSPLWSQVCCLSSYLSVCLPLGLCVCVCLPACLPVRLAVMAYDDVTVM